jgi:hypothetical protein
MMGFKEGGAIDAENVRAQGRNNDSMLVHMTPREVAGLQALAMRHGGSLTINPKTGLPEADFLESILPMILGFALGPAGFGLMSAGGAGLAVGGATTLLTGDLGKGLMAGLGAFGGGNLGAGLMEAGAASTAVPSVTPELATTMAGDTTLASSFTGPAASSSAPLIDGGLTSAGGQGVSAGLPAKPGFMDNLSQAGRGVKNLLTGQDGSFGKFIGSAETEKDVAKNIAAKPATGLGGTMGAIKTAGALAGPALVQQPASALPESKDEKSNYEGPYTPTPRQVRFPTAEERKTMGTSEFQYFTDVNPVPGFQPYSATQTAQPTTMGLPSTSSTLAMLSDEEKRRMAALNSAQPFAAAKGGSVPQLESGGFVLTKKAIDGLGKGDNKKGQRVASAGLGAIPIRGKGTGTSDSIKTSIDNRAPALVSNGEAYVPKDKVKRGGGAKKFYALMKKAERAAA